MEEHGEEPDAQGADRAEVHGASDDGVRDREDASGGRGDDLVSRLALVESQPLEDRAGAYGRLHDDLARRLTDDDHGA